LALKELSGTYSDHEAFKITKHAVVSSVYLFTNYQVSHPTHCSVWSFDCRCPWLFTLWATATHT